MRLTSASAYTRCRSYPGAYRACAQRKRRGDSMRVPQYLSEQEVAFETLVHPPSFTARKRAMYLHISGRLVAKAVLLKGPEGFVLAILPSTHHVDTPSLIEQFGGPVRLA